VEPWFWICEQLEEILMAAEIPDNEPTSFIAGDTVKWNKSYDFDEKGTFPASTWTLTYYFRGKDADKKTVVCTADGDDFLATISAATSATFQPGEYYAFAEAVSGTDKHIVWDGRIEVKENPRTGTAPQDRRSHARKMLDAIEDMLEGVASRFEQSYTIDIPGGGSRMLSTCSRTELIQFRAFYQREVAMEEQAERIAQGLAPRNKVHVRFVRPT
jgi:hypothetical protein